MTLQLRRREGIERRAFREQTAFELDALVGPAIHQIAELGYLEDSEGRVRLTRRGRFVADSVVESLLACAERT